MNLETLEAITKAAPKGPYHIGHIDENLGHVEIEDSNGNPIAEVFQRSAEALFCVSPTAMPFLIEITKAVFKISIICSYPIAKKFLPAGVGQAFTFEDCGECSECTLTLALAALQEAK